MIMSPAYWTPLWHSTRKRLLRSSSDLVTKRCSPQIATEKSDRIPMMPDSKCYIRERVFGRELGQAACLSMKMELNILNGKLSEIRFSIKIVKFSQPLNTSLAMCFISEKIRWATVLIILPGVYTNQTVYIASLNFRSGQFNRCLFLAIVRVFPGSYTELKDKERHQP